MKLRVPKLRVLVLLLLWLSASTVPARAQEVPDAVETDASGKAIIHVNQQLTKLRLKLDVLNSDGLLSAAGAHFHCGAAGENGPIIAFIAGPFDPGYFGHFQIRATLTDDSITGETACGSDIAELAMAMAEGDVYINVHSLSNPGGEIRGQVE